MTGLWGNFEQQLFMVRSARGILIFLSFAFSASHGQSTEVKAGINITRFSDVSNAKSMPGYYIGVAKAIPISERISFQPEVLYSMQRVDLPGNSRIPDQYFFHYVQMPLYFNLAISKRGGIAAGPQIGLLSRAKVRRDNDGTLLVTPSLDPFNLQVGGGPYLRYDRLTFDLRVIVGVTAIDRQTDRWKTFGLQIGASWSFSKTEPE